MPAMFAIGDKVVGNPSVATFAAFGAFAMVLLVDFRGPVRVRLQEQAALAVVGGGLICIGTLASRAAWLAALAMAVVGFAVLFAGVVSSVLAAAATALLLAFILPASLAAPASSIPYRLAGWGMAAGAAMIAIAVLWPAPARDPLRGPVMAACTALAERLRADVGYVLHDDAGHDDAGHDDAGHDDAGHDDAGHDDAGHDDAGHDDAGGDAALDEAARQVEHHEAVLKARVSVEALRRTFFATPYRPTGLSTGSRAVVRLVDELLWLDAVVTHSAPRPAGAPVNVAACQVKLRAADVLDRGVALMSAPAGGPETLEQALAALHQALGQVERTATIELPVARVATPARPAAGDGTGEGPKDEKELVSSLDPSFRAQELTFAVTQLASNIALAAAAERRGWLARLLGRQPLGSPGTILAARQRASSHLESHSVWLHNSLRGAIGLGLAVLVARLTGVQHSFWVVLGTLSVLRSNALNTGQNAVRGLLGTVAGFAIGAAILALIGTNAIMLWLLLPIAILLAGAAPAVISFAAGQAGFTLVLVILFNIVQPAGWRVGLLRVEDIAIGCAVSLLVGALFWPRGAAGALGVAMTEAYEDSAGYLAGAVEFGVGGADGNVPAHQPPTTQANRSAAAARRLDDAFRSYLAERGAKPVPLAEVTALVTGVVGLRLAGDAAVDLWQRDEGDGGGDRAAASRELLATTATVVGWYRDLAASLIGRADVPAPLPRDEDADQRLVDAVRHDLLGKDGRASAVAVRMIWTGDHLDAARRFQAALAGPARTASERGALVPVSAIRALWARGGRPRSSLGGDPAGDGVDGRERPGEVGSDAVPLRQPLALEVAHPDRSLVVGPDQHLEGKVEGGQG
jgi:uncharacterized membrane protein YccC